MSVLDAKVRANLEKAVLAAHEAAEKAARAALERLAVNQDRPFTSQGEEQRRLRRALRARARQLGEERQTDGSSRPVEEIAFGHAFPRLVEEVAYEQWHRMLFARFLAENQLLIHPSGVPVTLVECAELAAEEGEADAWLLAARYASRMLPGIFRVDDPSGQVSLAPEGRAALETVLDRLPSAVFTSDDGLGWVYQFWQKKRKKEVSGSGQKIEGLDVAAYSQLFTEDYMVRFLLENSLGAWWAARHPDSPLVKEFTYLRFRDDRAPVAGTFPGWPDQAAKITVMDPCCGSGHFLVATFDILRRMRVEEEGLGEAEAADAVLRDNLFGLEIDPRCVQIAAFALALAAWKAGGYRRLPLPNVACSGIAVNGELAEWTKLAGGDVNLQQTLERLYRLFRDAPHLGSLISPADVPIRDRMFTPDFGQVGPLLDRALQTEAAVDDPVAMVFGDAAKGVARAAQLLAQRYTLIATNVPYLARGKQGETLKQFIELRHSEAKENLATAFLEMCRSLTSAGSTYAVVTPQNWLFLSSYTTFRKTVLNQQTWDLLVRLGPGAFETIGGEVVDVALVVTTNSWPSPQHVICGLNAMGACSVAEKSQLCRFGVIQSVAQAIQLDNPDARVLLEDTHGAALLSALASCPQGVKTGDDARWRRLFWELGKVTYPWRLYQSTVERTVPYGGREHILAWGATGSEMARPQGLSAWHKVGVAVSQMSQLPVTLYLGDAFDSNVAPIIPKNPAHVPPIWAFCSSSEFNAAVRRIDATMKVTNATLVKVPFDVTHWQKVADEMGPLPEPSSNDPTQWLFVGNPVGSTEPLQVAVARLLGYHWPQQEPDRLSTLADEDGIVPLAPVAGEEPAEERIRAVLAAAYGDDWSPAVQERLLQQVGYGGKGLDSWLRDGFFAQHCQIFHQRPFIWHVWDGRKDGFSALVNYHRLDAACLDKLIYTYLGEWIRAQRGARDADEPGADARLVAALELQKKLEAIRDGEPPFDVFIRWKPLHQQPIGWHADLNDGVRLNIRPFVKAGVLRSPVNVKWGKDPGLNPDGSDRINDLHPTLAEKQAARRTAQADTP